MKWLESISKEIRDKIGTQHTHTYVVAHKKWVRMDLLGNKSKRLKIERARELTDSICGFFNECAQIRTELRVHHFYIER